MGGAQLALGNPDLKGFGWSTPISQHLLRRNLVQSCWNKVDTFA